MNILFTLVIVFGAILPSAVMISKYEIIQHFMAQPTKNTITNYWYLNYFNCIYYIF